MRVLMVLNELMPSGAESMLRVAAPQWARHGVTCEILSTGARLGPYAAALSDAGYALHHLPFARRPAFAWRLLRLFGGFDVVHVHTERAHFLYGLCARLAGARTVRTIHSSFAYTGWRRVLRIVQRRVLAWCGVTPVAIGESVAAIEREVSFNATTTVPNWFDTAAYRPPRADERAQARDRLQLQPSDIVLALVGNCAPVKNHAALIEALARLPAGLRRHLVVLHAGSGASEGDERRLAAERGVAAQWRFLGQLPDTREVLHAADAAVLPSLKEGFSVAALEALGCGLPLLLTDVPGLRDLRAVSPAIAWAAGPDAEALGVALVALVGGLDGPGGLAERARAQAADVAHRFGPARGVQAYVQIFGAGREAPCPRSAC